MENKKKRIKIKKAVYFVIFALLFILPSFFEAYSFWENTYESYEIGHYSITSFHVDINVNEKNVFSIEETITVLPDTEMRGIVRAIPVYQKVSFEENNKNYNLKYKTKISDIDVNQPYQIFEENGFLYIKLGSENVWFSASKTYKINYVMDLGDDRIAEFDQLYFNVIGTDWDAPISNISFNITMPKDLISGTKMFIYSGKYGSVNQQNVEVDSNLKTFSYSHSGSLDAYEGLTVRLKLDKDYFDFAFVQNLAWIFSGIVLFLFIALAIYFIIKLLKTKKQIITPVVMFEPPNNLPPSELGYIIDGVVDNQDITSLIIYWAEKGFLKIKEDNKKYTLIKTNEMEEVNGYQKALFNKIFGVSDSVKLEDIGQKIYLQVERTKVVIKAKHQNSQFDIKNQNSKKTLAFIAVALVTLLATTILKFSVEPLLRLGASILGLISLSFAYSFMHLEQIRFKKSLDQTKDKTFVYLIPILGIWLIMAFLGLNYYFDKLLLTFFVIFPATVLLLVAYKIGIRKDEGLELFGQVLGFKQFISLTEKDKIKMLAKENPEMFYSILPYAYVLGVSKEWIDKFEQITLKAPSWYESTSDFGIFDYLIMRSIFNSIMLSSVAQIGYKPPNMNSGGSSSGGGIGGGFTGGGFGGGGGRGW